MWTIRHAIVNKYAYIHMQSGGARARINENHKACKCAPVAIKCEPVGYHMWTIQAIKFEQFGRQCEPYVQVWASKCEQFGSECEPYGCALIGISVARRNIVICLRISMAYPCPCVRTLCLAHRKLQRCTILGKREVFSELLCGKSPCRDANAQLVCDIDLKLRSSVFPQYFRGEPSFYRRKSGWEYSNTTTAFRKDHFIPRFASLISDQISVSSLHTTVFFVIKSWPRRSVMI